MMSLITPQIAVIGLGTVVLLAVTFVVVMLALRD
jgi:hypothetical protein